MSTLIRAIRIKLDKAYTAVPDMGLYTEDGVSQLRYSESPLTGVSETYKNGILIESGDIECNADFRKGGASVQVSDITVKLAGTIMLGGAQRQFCYALDMAGISLIGLILEIIEFEGTEDDSDSVEVLTMFTGSIENISWNETEFIITVKSSLSLKRNACMTTVNSNGIVLPITFGSSDPENDRYFKAIRENAKEIKLKVEDLTQHTGTYIPAEMSLFPVAGKIGTTPSKIYDVRLGWINATAAANLETFLVDKWVLVREGKGNGAWAQIKTCTLIGSGQTYVRLEFYSYLVEDLAGNENGDLKDSSENKINSWINIIDLDKLYTLDTTISKGFFDSNGQYLQKLADIYMKDDDDNVKQIPHFGYDVNLDGDNNSMVINPLLFKGDSNSMASFLFLPVNEFKRSESSNLTDWSFPSKVKVRDGVYRTAAVAVTNISVLPANIEQSSNLFDKDINTSCSTQSTFSTAENVEWTHAFTFKLPALPKNLSFSNVYIGINAKIETNDSSGSGSTGLKVLRRGYINRIENCTNAVITNDVAHLSIYWDNLPDFYVERNLKNIQFWTVGDSQFRVGKYDLIDLKITSAEEYEGTYEVLIAFVRGTNAATGRIFNTFVNELFIMVESTASIRDSLYV